MNIGISSMALWNYGPDEAVKRASELGFTHWEVMLEGRHRLKNCAKIKELGNSYGVEFLVHSPFSDLNIASLNRAIRKESLSEIFGAIKIAARLESSVFTFHSGRMSPLGSFFREEAWKNNLEGINRIVKFGSDLGLKICLENMPNVHGAFCCDIGELREVLGLNPGLSLTLDVAHAHTYGNEVSYVKELKENISHVHLHDNDGTTDSHEEIGKGSVDFGGVLKRLDGFDGCFVIEARNEEEAAAGRAALEGLL